MSSSGPAKPAMHVHQEGVVVTWREPGAAYPDGPPFHPDRRHPESAFGETAAAGNHVYEGVRNCFHLAGLGQQNYGTPEWNPLSELIHPGETVLLKPNLVKESHPRDPEGWRYILTHGSVIRAVADYVWKAVGAGGKVILADAPQTDSSFAAIVSRLGLHSIRDFYRMKGLDFEVVDLRREEWSSRGGVVVNRRELPGDPRGAVAFDLAEASELAAHGGSGSYYGADYDAGEVNRHHSGGRHEYLVAGTAIECDVVFSLPKLKTHKKAGITAALKNLVGVNADKNWLPHHTEGTPSTGGDERPDGDQKRKMERRMVARMQRFTLQRPTVGPLLHRTARRLGRPLFGDSEEIVRSGNWCGNDTVWRMCLDLNKIVLYGNRDGTLREPLPQNRKRHYALVDGIVAGEGRGPMNPDPVAAGTLIFGVHAPSVDAACAWLMGFDPERIAIVRQAFRCAQYPLARIDWPDVHIISNEPQWNGALTAVHDTLRFQPHFGWKGRIERDRLNATEDRL